MPLTSALPYLVLMPAYVLVGALVARWSRFYRAATAPAAGARYEALDGLRGFLAMGVFFHHAVITYHYKRTGAWIHPDSQLYTFLGPGAVTLFFMITGFLFWSKAMRGGGRVPALPLYRNRVRRLAPAYLATIAVALAVAAVATRGRAAVSLGTLLAQLGRMLSLGVFDEHVLNGYWTVPVNAGVTWTLWYEWRFYLLLPVLAWGAVRRRVWLLLPVVAGVYFYNAHEGTHCLKFYLGMATAHLTLWPTAGRVLARRWMTPVLLAPLVLLALRPTTVEGPVATALLVVPFAGFACGNDVFGLLRSRGAKYLGAVSYSLYLGHGLVLFAVTHLVEGWRPVTALGPRAYWALMAGTGLLAVLGAGVSYRFIEHPFLERKATPPVPAPAPAPSATRV